MGVKYPVELIPHADGFRRIKISEGTATYNTTRAYYQLDNLFGDKALSDNMNKLLNDNWETVLKDIGGAVPVAMEAVIRAIAVGIFSKIAV